jgi:SAM-dependent methyltransferase
MEREHQERYGQLGEGYWWLAGKYRIVADLLRRAAPPGAGGRGRVLDLGCGPGNFLDLLAPHGRTFGSDYSVDALRYCASRGHARLSSADFHQLPFAGDSFSLITCIDVLEHLRDDAVAAAEIARVMAPGALLVMTVPAFAALWGDHDELYGHYRRYRVPQLRRRLEGAGLVVERATYFEPLYLPPLFLYRKWKRLRPRRAGLAQRDDFVAIGPRLNRFLTGFLAAERHLLRLGDIPFGVTIVAMARKPPRPPRIET